MVHAHPRSLIMALVPILASTSVALPTIACLTAAAPVQTASAQTNPAPPPGRDATGTPIALMGDGADYTRPEIAARLARDGEGQLIAWDFADDDARPFSATGAGTDDAVLLVTHSTNVRLILVRQRAADPKALGHMIAFALQTPARILLWPDADQKRPDWPVLPEAAKLLPHLLFIIPETGPAPRLQNVLAVPPTTTPNANPNARQAAIIAAAKAADVLAKEPALTAAALKLRLLNGPK
jgi:hypothetical protein